MNDVYMNPYGELRRVGNPQDPVLDEDGNQIFTEREYREKVGMSLGNAREMTDSEHQAYLRQKEKGPEDFMALAMGIGISKPTNPKDGIGISKWRQFFTLPQRVLWEVGVGMLEGAMKYGRHNYRVAGVQASIYTDAAMGHITAWIEGEDIDPDSGLSHITKAICSLMVLRDGMIEGNFTDDRPPRHADFDAHRAGLQAIVDELFEKYPNQRSPFTEVENPREERA